jgi:hypothetical protein
LPANPQKPILVSRSAHLHIMHPDPKHLKNFARNTQWSRGNSVMNILFFNRSHLPGFDRLKASGRVCHLIRAIGHHIVRLACRSVTIMARLTACWSDQTWTRPSRGSAQALRGSSTINHANLLPPVSFRSTDAWLDLRLAGLRPSGLPPGWTGIRMACVLEQVPATRERGTVQFQSRAGQS